MKLTDKNKIGLTALILRIVAAVLSFGSFIAVFPMLIFSFYPFGIITAVIIFLSVTAVILWGSCFRGGRKKSFDIIYYPILSLPPAVLLTLLILIQTGALRFPG